MADDEVLVAADNALERTGSGRGSLIMGSGVEAVHAGEIDEVRKAYDGHVKGDVTLVAPELEPGFNLGTAFLGVDRGMASQGEFVWKSLSQEEIVGKLARRGRFEGRGVRSFELRENGMLVCGPQFVPPDLAWRGDRSMDDVLNGHLLGGAQSHGKHASCFAIEGCQDMCLSLLPSVSGGYVLTQENTPKELSVCLCLNKSLWRDRLILEEGMELEIGSLEDSKCYIHVMSVQSATRNTSIEMSSAQQVKKKPNVSKEEEKATSSDDEEPDAEPNAKKLAKEKEKQKHVHFGTSEQLWSGKVISLEQPDPVSLYQMAGGQNTAIMSKLLNEALSASDEDVMATVPIWSTTSDHERASLELKKKTFSSNFDDKESRNKGKGDEKMQQVDRSKIVFRVAVGEDRSQVYEFSPPIDRQRKGKSNKRKSVRRQRKQTFTIGGASSCNIVIPDCPIKILASIVAFDGCFTLMTGSGLGSAFHRGQALSKTQRLYAQMTSIHLVLDPEQPWNIFDGDAIVLRDNAHGDEEHSKDGQDCCTGAEIYVRLCDPTERRRMKRNKIMLESVGQKQSPVVPLASNKTLWLQRATFATLPSSRKKNAGREELVDLACEVRAPIRISHWDGSTRWKYGETEAFRFEGITATADVSIGASPVVTLSIKDSKMSRHHASIFKKSGKKSKGGFLMEASISSGKKSILRLIGGSAPPGLGPAASPPHLLLAGEVFRVGATEFKVIGFTKVKASDTLASKVQGQATGRGSGRSAGSGRASDAGQRPSVSRQKGSLRKKNSMGTDDFMEYMNEMDSDDDDDDDDEDLGRVTRLDTQDLAEKLDQIESTQFQDLQTEGEESMKKKMETSGSIPLVRHLPNEDDAPALNIVSSFYSEEDGSEIHITNNVDKTFGLARLDEYEDVLKAFGLDEDTRSLTFPDLSSFMIIQCVKGTLLRRIFLIDLNDCTIGSASQCSIMVPNDPLISLLHCRIVYNEIEGHWRLVDCQSRLGTFIRSTSEDDPTLLQPGQRFLIGHSQLRILGKSKQRRTNSLRNGIRSLTNAVRSTGLLDMQSIPGESRKGQESTGEKSQSAIMASNVAAVNPIQVQAEVDKMSGRRKMSRASDSSSSSKNRKQSGDGGGCHIQ